MLAGKTCIRYKTPSLSKIHLKCSYRHEILGLNYAKKTYINLILFTCCVTQAINLEIAIDLGKRFSLLPLR